MHKGFIKGMIVGGIIGASVSSMMDPGVMHGKSRKRMMRAGKHMLRRTGGFLDDVVDIFR